MNISIIVPVYNAEKTIEKCVESIVYGQFPNVEVILVEDCSKDNSWKKCQDLATKYKHVQCYQNTSNRGVSYARNQGILKATGEYILFVDSDDWVSGAYVTKLLEAAEQHKDSLVICGLHFVDEMAWEKRDYVWQADGEDVYYIGTKQFFELPERFHLQQLWNKIFKREIIEKYHIRFDENQSMGEDFQFVIDYMEAMHCKQCVVLNEALYYYVRANNSSLMSQFGLIENGNEYKRLEKLLKISGENIPEIREQYNKAIESTKMSYVYFIARAKNKTMNEKVSMIENIVQNGQAKAYYRQQKKIKFKEDIVVTINKFKKLIERVKGRVQRERRKLLIKQKRLLLKNKDVSIISQNCIAGVFYNDMQLQFLSPTINLYFECPDFVHFVLNLHYYVEQELKMEWNEMYPVGTLDDIRIHFMHYQTCTEAKLAWERRCKRINWDKILILSTDMRKFSEKVFEEWKCIPYPKLLFTAKKVEDKSCVWYPEYEENGRVGDLIPKREFYKNNTLFHVINTMK